MAHVITDNCIKCKYMDCVEVCPVDCFYVGENMLVIHPDECIDCGVCVPECPAEAIFPDTDPQAEPFWLDHNRKYAEQWPNIMKKGSPPSDADAWNGAPDKYGEHFSPKPGEDLGRILDPPFQRAATAAGASILSQAAIGEARMSNSTADTSVVDVRTLPPAQRHATIFQLVDELEGGRTFTLVNDHDPKPLYYQLEAEYPGQFSWTYLERGPDVWRVEIGKTAQAA